MKSRINFASSLADRMIDFIAFKRMQGYDYTSRTECLKRFDTFLARNECNDILLHPEDMQSYCAETAGLNAVTRTNLHSSVRQFSIYLHAVEPRSAVLPKHMQPRNPHPIRFYPLCEAQVCALMAATDTLSIKDGIWPHCMRFLIGLLYSTGLRIGEALSMKLQDVNMENSTLFVRQGKFRKERIVLMSSSTLDAMEAWLKRRQHYAGSEASAPLFIAQWNQSPSYQQASIAFRYLRKHCGFDEDPPLRFHDLRHNYACRCIALWREEKENVNTMLPVLANAMGHVDFFSTQVYVHIDAGSLQQASVKFNTHIKHHLEHSK